MYGSPSQRLRATFYLVWEVNTDRKKNFDDYYVERMESLIRNVRKELDPPEETYDTEDIPN
jgi:hypothetical protein